MGNIVKNTRPIIGGDLLGDGGDLFGDCGNHLGDGGDLLSDLSIFIRQRSTCYVNVNDCSRFNFIQRLREFSKYLGSMIFTLFKHRKELPL